GFVTAAKGRGETRHPYAQKDEEQSRRTWVRNDGGGLKSFPLGLVLQACPEILAYGPDGAIRNWRDLLAEAVFVLWMLVVRTSSLEVAAYVMVPENAASVLDCIMVRF
ncbi:replication initiation protein RepC, partial [Rhizobium ruizarguesonis]